MNNLPGGARRGFVPVSIPNRGDGLDGCVQPVKQDDDHEQDGRREEIPDDPPRWGTASAGGDAPGRFINSQQGQRRNQQWQDRGQGGNLTRMAADGAAACTPSMPASPKGK